MYKKIFVLLSALLLGIRAWSQSYTFKVYASSGGDYVVTINAGDKTVSAVRGGSTVFSYSYRDYKIETNLIGFSFGSQSSVIMKPDHNRQYFLVRQDAIFCSTSNASQEFYFKPVSEQSYSSEFSRLRSGLSAGSSYPGGRTASGSNRTFTVKGVSFTMVYVQGGTFQMGSDTGDSDEKPVHSVTLSPYYIGQTEVTQELWEAVMGTNPSYFKGSKRPVEHVSWNDCQDFVNELSRLTGERFHLPTEAQWEFAARGGVKSTGCNYAGSNAIATVAWYTDNSGSETHTVATKSPNELGIYDMSGNVWEWCQDWKGSYSSSAQTNPVGPSSGSNRVFRGGGWGNSAAFCRPANRSGDTPSYAGDRLGLRLAL